MTTRPGRLTRLAATVALLGVLTSACASGSDGSSARSVAAPATTSSAGGPSSPTSTDTGTGSATPATTPAAAPVPEALQFSAPLVGGGEFSGADYTDKPTVFWFWAPT